MNNGSSHVVIVGWSFAGLACARKLAKSDDVQVTLIDKNNYHQFQPLLYQLATAELSTSDVTTSLSGGQTSFLPFAKLAIVVRVERPTWMILRPRRASFFDRKDMGCNPLRGYSGRWRSALHW